MKIEKNTDEFFTTQETVEKEINKWIKHMKGKVVYCPCDSLSSAFVKYFRERLAGGEIAEVIITGNKSSLTESFIYREGEILYGYRQEKDVGDCLSKDTFKIMENNADFIVTCPPTSCFGDFLNLCIKSKKKFLLLGEAAVVKDDDIVQELITRGKAIAEPGDKTWFRTVRDVPGAKRGIEGGWFIQKPIVWIKNWRVKKKE